MATNKNQHFVPRCYLRAFTAGGGNKTINIFNIDHARYIADAPVRSQCSGDYFYGQNRRLEDAILHVEGSYDTEIRSLIAGCDTLSRKSAFVLRSFWVLQYMRTEAASMRSAQMTRQFADAIGEGDFAMSIKEAVLLAMSFYVDQLRITDDLAICVVRNMSDVPFITSDDPAVLTNRWHIHRQWHQTRSFGLGSTGMIGLLPLSQDLLCVLYDSWFYDVATADGFVGTASRDDVAMLNEHQILNCHANLYARDASEQYLRSEVQRVAAGRIYPRTQLTYAVRDGGDDTHARYRVVDSRASEPHDDAIVHSRQVYAEPSGWPSFIRWRHRGYLFVPEDVRLRRDRNHRFF